MPGDPHSVWLRNATTCNPVTLWRVFVNVQLHIPGDPHSIWLGHATTCNPVTLWRVFVNVQLHIPGDPHSVWLGHATTTSNSTTLIKYPCLTLIGTMTVLCQVCGQTDASKSIPSFYHSLLRQNLAQHGLPPFTVCATPAENRRADLSEHTSMAWYLLHSRLVCIVFSASFGQTFLLVVLESCMWLLPNY